MRVFALEKNVVSVFIDTVMSREKLQNSVQIVDKKDIQIVQHNEQKLIEPF